MRFSAIRIKHLPPGKVQFETLMEKNVEGLLSQFYKWLFSTLKSLLPVLIFVNSSVNFHRRKIYTFA